MVKLKITGIKKTLRFLDRKEASIKKARREAMKKIGFFMEAEVKLSISGQRDEKKSVDTGQFRNSVRGRGTETEATVQSNVVQANILEKGTSKIPARRHFGNSLDRNRNKITSFLRQEIKTELTTK